MDLRCFLSAAPSMCIVICDPPAQDHVAVVLAELIKVTCAVIYTEPISNKP